jgi:hypothetical protein
MRPALPNPWISAQPGTLPFPETRNLSSQKCKSQQTKTPNPALTPRLADRHNRDARFRMDIRPG